MGSDASLVGTSEKLPFFNWMWDSGCPPGLGPGSVEKSTFDSCHPDSLKNGKRTHNLTTSYGVGGATKYENASTSIT